jgi:hypothetical protein
VEPEDEFYLQLGSNASDTVYVDLSVDGMPIQKGHRLYPNITSKVGVIRAADNGGIGTEVALRFAKAKVCPRSSIGAAACKYWTGEIKATFYGDPRYSVPEEALPKPEGLEVRAISSPRTATVTPNTTRVEEANQAPAAVLNAAPKQTPVTTLVDKVNQAPAAPVTYAAPKQTYYTNSKLASSDVGYVPGISDDKHKKGVKSAEGTTALRTHRFNWSSSSNNMPTKPPAQNLYY